MLDNLTRVQFSIILYEIDFVSIYNVFYPNIELPYLIAIVIFYSH